MPNVLDVISEKTICYNQVKTTTSFRSCKNQNFFKIYHNLNCKSNFLIYQMECALSKVQYVGKSEKSFNFRLNKKKKNQNW